jgi:hypothetical protein
MEQTPDCHGNHEEEKVELARREPWLPDLANLPCNFLFFLQLMLQ